jgi:hypothetical protein
VIQWVNKNQNASIAQLVEHLFCKQDVVGSNPTGGSNQKIVIMEMLSFNGRFMTKEGKKNFLRDWERRNERLAKMAEDMKNTVIEKGEDGFVKITLWNGEIVTFAKDLDDAKVAISEAVLVKKITKEKFGK